MRRNPKYALDPWLARDLRRYRDEGAARVAISRVRTGERERLTAEPNDARRAVGFVDFDRRVVLVRSHATRLVPTTVHWLVALARAVPELDDFEVRIMTSWRDSVSSELTLGAVAARATAVRERAYRDWPHGAELATYDYLALPPLEGMTLFHATLAWRLRSILRSGLQPSSGEAGRIEGWSPGWNAGLQEAVYLFTEPDMAVRVGMELSTRAYADAVVLAVDGRALSDTRLRIPDEDGLRSDIDESVLWQGWDRDFPPWVTSAESRTRSLAYAAAIAPSALSVWLKLVWAPDMWEEDGEEFMEPAWEFSGPREGVAFAQALFESA